MDIRRELEKLVEQWREKAKNSRVAARHCCDLADYDGMNSYNAFATTRNACADDIETLIAKEAENEYQDL